MLHEASRYKVAAAADPGEAEEFQQNVLHGWPRFFGHETGAEFERLNIEKRAKGEAAASQTLAQAWSRDTSA